MPALEFVRESGQRRGSSDADARAGRRVSSPPQLGQTKLRRDPAHSRQNVHSKLQMYASLHSQGRSRPQRSQPGRISRPMFTLRGRQKRPPPPS